MMLEANRKTQEAGSCFGDEADRSGQNPAHEIECQRLTSEETTMSIVANVGTPFHPFMKKNYTQPAQDAFMVKQLLYQTALPPTGSVNVGLCICVGVSSCYGTVLSILRMAALPYSDTQVISDVQTPESNFNNSSHIFPDDSGPPSVTRVVRSDGNIFGLFLLFVVCLMAGGLAKLMHLPPLLGMLLMGICLGNVPHIDFARFINKRWGGVLRKTAFVVILIQGGLGLDFQALRRLKGACLRLAFFPCLLEALTVMLAARLMLGMPWVFGLVLGFVLGAVSPAICVPSMLSLSERGLGVEQGIPTLVIAASSTDDVLAITAFSVLLSISFASGEVWMAVLRGPVDVILGVIYGLLVGILLQYIPDPNSEYRSRFRVLLLLCLSLLAMFGSGALRVDGAGALACLISAFLANHGWKKEGQTETVEKSFSVLWFVCEPLLFGLIGAQLDVRRGVSVEAVLGALGVLCLGLVVRTGVAGMAVLGSGFTFKEHIFIALAWLPKATVQAALGPVVYDTAEELNMDGKVIRIGMQILTVAVLGILVTAPLGAALISLTGPVLLRRKRGTPANDDDTKDKAIEDVEMNLL